MLFHTSWLRYCLLTCVACTGLSLGASTRANIPVQRSLWGGQQPAVTERGCGCCQGLAAQSPSWLVHGIRVGYRHCHMHGEVLLRQCCRLQGGDKHTHTVCTHIKSRLDDESNGSVVVMASLTERSP